MTNINKSYAKEFKQEAIKLALSSESITATARGLGIPEATLHTWVRKAKNSSQQNITIAEGIINNATVANIVDENRELKKRIARLEQEKSILKKAATYFATELG